MKAGYTSWSFLVVLASRCMYSVESLSPSTTPEQIIMSQLTALQKDDMVGVYEYASPNNRRRTGDIQMFAMMVRQGPYKNLIGHKKADILMTSKIAASMQFLVRVLPADDPTSTSSYSSVVEYWWSLSRCKVGPYAGCYMVDAVIPNL